MSILQKTKTVHSVPQHRSVFEKDVDNTVRIGGGPSVERVLETEEDVDPQSTLDRRYRFRERVTSAGASSANSSTPSNRWKFSGPWVGGMSEGDFQRDFIYPLRRRYNDAQGQFREYLRAHAATKKIASIRRQARDDGAEQPKPGVVVEINDAELDDHIHLLREDASLTSDLSTLVRDFLDLPALPVAANEKWDYSISAPMSSAAEAGPPATHPSAGVSYSRSNAYAVNHPVLGPRASHPRSSRGS